MKAFQEGQLLFNSSAIYINAMAAHHQNTSAVSEVCICHPSHLKMSGCHPVHNVGHHFQACTMHCGSQ